MRYKENREQTAELLRMVLPRMARHAAGFNPITYAVWYEYLAGINPSLTAALDARLAEGASLTDADLAALYDKHVADRDLGTTELMTLEIERLVGEVDGAALEASDEVRHYGDELHRFGARLLPGIGQDELGELVAALIIGTNRVREKTDALSDHLRRNSEEVQRLRAELEVAQGLAWRDSLTGLLNRRGLDQRLATEWFSRPGSCGVLIVDIDQFKAINDAHGHLLGDKVIIAVARAITSAVGDNGPVARIGGEEFAALLWQATPERAFTVAEQVRSAVERGRIHRADRELGIGGVTVSIGVAAASAGEDFESVLERADRALYQSKQSGRNRVTLDDRLTRAAV